MGKKKIMSINIINMPNDVIDIIILHVVNNNYKEDIFDYYCNIINLKISCKTFLYQLKYFKYYDLIKTYFNIFNKSILEKLEQKNKTNRRNSQFTWF